MIKVVVYFFKIMPFIINRFFGLFIGSVLFLTNNKKKRIIKQNIKICFDNKSKNWQKKLVRKTIFNQGMFFAELLVIWGKKLHPEHRLIKKIMGLSLIDNDKPTILFGPHFGSFELTGKIASFKRKITFLYKESKNKELNKIIIKSREDGLVEMVDIGNSGIAKLSRSLKNNGLIGMHPDHNPQGDGYEIAKFLGVLTKTTTLCAKLAIKYNAVLLLGYTKRNFFGFEINIKEIKLNSNNIKENIQKINDAMSEVIIQNPEQYLWDYRRFKDSYNYD